MKFIFGASNIVTYITSNSLCINGLANIGRAACSLHWFDVTTNAFTHFLNFISNSNYNQIHMYSLKKMMKEKKWCTL